MYGEIVTFENGLKGMVQDIKLLSQPFHVAETFTGVSGKYVPLKETIRGFKMIIDGEMDEYPENAFFNVGGVEDVIEKAKTMVDQTTKA